MQHFPTRAQGSRWRRLTFFFLRYHRKERSGFAGNRTLVLLDVEQEEANVLILMVFHSGAMGSSQINGKYGARGGPSRKFRTTTRRLSTKKTRAHVIVEEDIQPQSRAERTRSLILAAVRVWELKRGIRG